MNNKEFNEKWNGRAYDAMIASGDWSEYIGDCFDMYETEGFCDTFVTLYNQYAKYNGQRYELIRRSSPEDGWELESLPAWKIRFSDGVMIDAWPEEICKIERKAM